VRLPAGKQLFAEGSHGDRAYIIKEGELEVVKTSAGHDVLLAVQGPPQVIGEMALLENQPRMAAVRARTDAVLLAITKEQLDRLLATSSSAARAMFYTVLARWRSTEAMLRQSERMAQLGTLTAGVAHELNNPAAAVKRGADQLQEAWLSLVRAQAKAGEAHLSGAQWETLERLLHEAQERPAGSHHLSALDRSDREAALEEWLDKRGVEDPWERAPALVSMGYDAARLAKIGEGVQPEQIGAAVGWLAASYSLHGLVLGIGVGAGRISDIVKALKSYSYLDQAPMVAVDIHEGLENTLLILAYKLRSHVTVKREYAKSLPKIEAYGAELNQVWTNIIDNAVDAIGERDGTVTLRTRQENGWVAVDIEDDGPGIPEAIQPRVFDAFFTTKPPGKGTGLGLNISYNIVVHKHRGEIKVTSKPGKTCFQIRLPTQVKTG
jgi:signal transduction histidine kinase